MDTNELQEQSQELASTVEESNRFVGDDRAHIELLRRMLSETVEHIENVTEAFLSLGTKVEELEGKLEFARLYGFSISAEDE